MSNGLGHLVKMIVGTRPAEDAKVEKVDQYRIIDMTAVHLSELFSSPVMFAHRQSLHWRCGNTLLHQQFSSIV